MNSCKWRLSKRILVSLCTHRTHAHTNGAHTTHTRAHTRTHIHTYTEKDGPRYTISTLPESTEQMAAQIKQMSAEITRLNNLLSTSSSSAMGSRTKHAQ